MEAMHAKPRFGVWIFHWFIRIDSVWSISYALSKTPNFTAMRRWETWRGKSTRVCSMSYSPQHTPTHLFISHSQLILASGLSAYTVFLALMDGATISIHTSNFPTYSMREIQTWIGFKLSYFGGPFLTWPTMLTVYLYKNNAQAEAVGHKGGHHQAEFQRFHH